jgi:tetratricopeptide (TPR) repeat protein
MFDDNASQSEARVNIEGAILDAELLVKYRFVERAIACLEQAIQFFPKNVLLREKLCEVCMDHNFMEKAAEQSIALSTLYAEGGDLERANAVLMQAKSLNPGVSIAARLEALKKVGNKPEAAAPARRVARVLAGDLATINLFDVIQVVENSRITGILVIESSGVSGRIYFNHGQIADAQAAELRGVSAFRSFVDVCDGIFEMEKSPVEFKQNISAPNNTNLILDVLREIDEEKRDMMS